LALRRIERRVILEPRLDYDGSQLRPHFLRSQFGVQGDAVVAFRGAAEVRGANLVDLEDREQARFILSKDMLHVMLERFDTDLVRAVLVQRLLCALVADRVRAAAGREPVQRKGDDVYIGQRKLTVSIATVSPVSALVHLGINVDATGAPVSAIGLADLKVDVRVFAEALLMDLDAELESVAGAVSKVAPAHRLERP
jgi:hypothetical protein